MNKETRELVERGKRLSAEAVELYLSEDAEDITRADGLMEEAKGIGDKVERLLALEEQGKQFDALAERGITPPDPEPEPEPEPEPDGSASFKGYDIPGPKRGEFSTMGHFLQTVFTAQVQGKRDPRLVYLKDEQTGHEAKDMTEGVGAAGGFLVPPEFLTDVMSQVGEMSIVRPSATIIPMRRRQISIPVLDQTGTTAGVAHWFGGLLFYWTEEAAEKTESDPEFRQVTLVAHKLIGYTVASDELVADSAISLDAFLAGPLGFAGGVMWTEDYCFLRGSGAGQPLGIVNAGATITVNRAAVGTPVQIADLVNMMENFLPSGRGQWVLNQTVMSNILQLTDPASQYVFIPNASDTVPGRLFGMPMRFTEKLPTVGNAGDVLLADMSYYLIGDRQAATVESTKYDKWRYDETSWRVVHRVDGKPWLSAPLTLQDGTAQVSPFVILGDKST